MAILGLSPLLGLIALLVRQNSPGLALFSKPCWAGADRQFTALKFRPMYQDGERQLGRHFLSHPQAEREYARYRKLDKAPRVTTAGRFLCAASRDEMPQLFNVLKGGISIIGWPFYKMDELSKLGTATYIIILLGSVINGFWQVNPLNQLQRAGRAGLSLRAQILRLDRHLDPLPNSHFHAHRRRKVSHWSHLALTERADAWRRQESSA